MTDLPSVQFTPRLYRPKKKSDAFEIPWQEDLYGPLLKLDGAAG